MKRCILLGLTLFIGATVHAAQLREGKPVFNYDPAAEEVVENTVAADDSLLQNRDACMHKAQLGEQLALKKMHGFPLPKVLQGIREVGGSARSDQFPLYIVLEMQRLARDAYRINYQSTADVDDFVLDLYSTCLRYGW